VPVKYTKDDLLLRVKTIYLDFQQLTQAVKSGVDDPQSRIQIRQNAQALMDVASAILDNKKGIKNSNDPNNPQAGEAITQAQLDFIGQNMTVPKPGDADQPGLDDFFHNIANSLVEAQKRLNQTSLEYSAEVQAQFKGFIPPTQYIIPSVKASMQVGISEMSQKSVNLVFLNDQTRKEHFSQNTITFDLVAAPPQPGGLTALTPFLLIEGKDALLARAVATIPEVAAAITLDGTISFPVVFQLPKTSAGSRYLVVYLIQDAKTDILNPEWKALVMFGLADDGTKLTLLTDLLDSGSAILSLSTKTDLRSRPKTDLTNTVLDMGDVVMNILGTLHNWMSSIGVKQDTK